MSGFSREQVGSVKSECGVLTIVCPSQMIGDPKGPTGLTTFQAAKKAVLTDTWCGKANDAFAFAVPVHDGEYPVYGTYGKDGELLGIEIDLREDR